MRIIRSVAAGTGRTRIHLDVYEIGPDLLVVLWGEGPHIGAATLTEVRPDAGTESTTLSARGHRESELTSQLSNALGRATGRRTLTLAGVHLDDIKRSEIEAIRKNVRRLISELAPVVARRRSPDLESGR